MKGRDAPPLACQRVILGTLSPREAHILRLRLGLNGEGEQTLEEISETYSVTRERIRQIESKALKKLRRPCHLHRLRPSLRRRSE